MHAALGQKLLRMAESLIRIAKTIISEGFETFQIEFAVTALTKKYTTSTGFKMTWDLVFREFVSLLKNENFLEASLTVLTEKFWTLRVVHNFLWNFISNVKQ